MISRCKFVHNLPCEQVSERIAELEDENTKLKNNNNYLHEALSESREANEHLHTELKRYKSILRTRPNAMTALYDENAELRELLSMYVTFARLVACGYRIQSAYADGMGRKLNETELRERAMKLGIEWCR